MLESGVAAGGTFSAAAALSRRVAAAAELAEPVVALGFDTFEGLPPRRDGVWSDGCTRTPLRARCSDVAKQNYDRQVELFEKRVIAQATLDTYKRNVETATQTLNGAKAEEERARLAWTSDIGGVNTQVADLGNRIDEDGVDLPSDPT